MQRYKHLVAYLDETVQLRATIPRSQWDKYAIGFLRYRRIMRKDAEVHSARWDSTEILEQGL